MALGGEAVEFERFSKFLGKWLEVRLFRPERGKLAFMFQDITGRKRTEKALRESEKEAKRLAQEAEVLAKIGWLVGSTLEIEAVYPSFAEEAKKLISFDRLSVNLNRYQENAVYVAYASGLEIEGRRGGDLFPLPGSSNEKVAKKGAGMIISAQGDGNAAEDFSFLNSLRAVGLQSNLSVPLITGDQVIGALHFRCKASGVYTGQHLDLAQRIANQIAGAIANAQLFAERNDLEKQLIQTQKMEAIGTLAGGIAHDFNNILATIIGFSQLVGLSVAKDPKTEKNLQEVIHAANRARDLVKQILTFSRRTDQERRPLQMELVVKEGLKLLRASLPATVEIQQEMASNGGTVMANPTQINQVLLNLCTNAAQAMGEDGGRLGVRLNLVEVDENMTFQVPDLQMGSYLCLEVSDTGQGIRPEILGKIFEPYFTTKPVGVGTGLGLAVVHGIVKGHGGAIAVKSEVGKGTTFRVFFPRLPAAGRVEVGSIPEAWRKGKGERILFVDDEQPLVEIARQALEHLGYGVEVRTSSVEALELFRAHPDGFDLVIADLTMPNLTGDKLAMEMLRIRPEIPILLLITTLF